MWRRRKIVSKVMIGMVLLPREGEVTGLICTGGSDVVEKGEGYDDAS